MEPIAELVFNMIAIMAFYQVRFANSEENLNDEVSKIKSEKFFNESEYISLSIVIILVSI